MRLTVFNLKGGVGKTPISFSLAKDLNMDIQTNDNSVLASIYPERAQHCKPYLADNVVYDFGGFVDSGILPIIKESDVVLVPCSTDFNSILRTVETIEAIKPHAKHIIVIVTKTEKEDDFHTVMDAIAEVFEDIVFYELRNSKVFKNSIETGKSVTELYHETPLSKSAYKTVFQQYNTVLELFKTV